MARERIDGAGAPTSRAWLLAVAAMVGSAACWGLATVMSKGALGFVPPFTLLAGQLVASVLFLWTAALATGAVGPVGEGARIATLAGVLEPGLAYAVGTVGLSMTGAAHAAMIGATEPLVVLLLAWVLLQQRPSGRTALAIVAAVVGIALVTAAPQGGDASIIGDGLVVIGTVFASLYVVLTSRFALEAQPLHLAARQQSVGLAFALALWGGAILARQEAPALGSLAWQGWVLIAASGIVQYALAFWLYLIGLRVLPVHAAALFLALIPVFGTAGAMLFLGESVGVQHLAGTALVIAAIVAGTRTAPHHR